jgi:bifunctional non-homologous end joining protein LigD
MPLEEYRRKRDFGRTPEPSGNGLDAAAVAASHGGRFVVQRHRATRLHYDFRLEIEGVLVSWAVPRGPTIDAGQRRMAVHVEDHPIEYLDFEGVIPKGQYGAGDVIVWDWGTWQPEAETPDPRRAIDDGELKFRLDGQKVKGRFTIVRTSGRGSPRAFEDGEAEQWLLIHKRDADSQPGWDAEDHPKSVKTGRTNDEVKEERDAIWISEAPAATARIDLSAATEAPWPGFLPPMAATLADRPFRDEDWLFEIKWDGYRLQAHVRDGKVKTFTRNGHDGEAYFPRLLTPGTWIDAREAIVDGEVVAIKPDGMPDFGLLQERMGEAGRASGGLVYQAFDLLYLDGRSLLKLPLEDRKKLLRSILRDDGRIRYATHVETEGVAFYEAASKQGLEGVLAKLRRSTYEPGRRSPAWLKLKIRPEQELVVGGWTPGEGNAKDLGALVVGVYEPDPDAPPTNGRKASKGSRATGSKATGSKATSSKAGGSKDAAPALRLRFGGKVGSGFDGRTRKMLRERLAGLETSSSPFNPPPPKDYRGRWGGDLGGVVWTKPELVIRAEIGGWTREGIVRQSAFKGIDEGKDPYDVRQESAVASAAAVATAEQEAPDPQPDDPGPKRKTGKAARLYRWEATPDELSALDALGKEGTWSVGGFELKLTNLDKPLFPPRDGDERGPITKRELIRYFARIAPTVLPHLDERALNLTRYPDGAGSQGFWQKDIPKTAPDWLRRWREVGVDAREANEHLVADRVATCCWLGNQASFEFHAWTSRLDAPWRPTFALIDIDPGEKTTWEETLILARLYRTALGHLGVRGYPKTTGKRGIQVWIPIEPRYEYGQTSDWVEKLSRAVGAIVPDLVSWEWAKSSRSGRARLDYTQNQPIKTLVAPYAVRPAIGAPVSTPISWDELDDPELRPDRWTIRDVVERVEEVGDRFAGAQTDLQVLPPI